MMPDLGRYALEVGLAYGGSIAALVLIVGLSLWRSARVRAALDEAEARWAQKNG